MTWLMAQTFLLMSAAFFLGALVSCLIRSMFFDADEVVTVPEPVPARPAAVAPAPQPIATRAAPEPVQPRIEPVVRPSVTPPPAAPMPPPAAKPVGPIPAASVDPARFERALTSPPVTPAVTPPPAAPPTAAPVVPPLPRPAPPRPPVAETPPPAPPKPVEPAKPAVDPAVAAAAAAAAASAIAAAARPAAATPAAPVATPQLPIASGTGGPSAVAAPSAPRPAPTPVAAPAAAPTPAPVAAAPVAPAEDLTRISRIDGVLQGRLNSLGVRRYEDITKWRAADVARINGALGFADRRIQRENWIEQAQVLAKGGLTAYAARVARGEATHGVATGHSGFAARPPGATAHSGVAAKPPAATPHSGTPAVPPLPAAPAKEPEPPKAEPKAEVQPAAPVATSTVAAPRTGAEAAAAAAAAVAAAAASASGGPSDKLMRIASIDAETERLLYSQGVKRYWQIAGWLPSDVAAADRLLNAPGRVAREGWIEQAQVLAKGGLTAHAAQYDRALTPVEPMRPAKLGEAIKDATAKAATAPAVVIETIKPTPPPVPPAVPPQPQPASDDARGQRADLSGLRSVRSEHLRGDTGTRTAANDDLKRIRGIGVLIEKKLNSLGITSYDQVANWAAADIERISQILDFKGRIERENWVEQARILSAGGATEFSRRVDRGDVESSKPKS